MKIAIIGGGSTYSPEVIEGFILRAEQLGIDRVTLMDVDPERLEIVGGFAGRMVQHAGSPFALEATSDRKAALDGASFVLTQIRVGGQSARHADIQLGLRHGLIGQETTGIGGMAKALRTVPVIMDLCEQIKQVAPEAWIINFTNPSGIISEAILNHARVKCIGLCNVPIEMKMTIAKHLGVKEHEIEMDCVGLNHLGWVRSVTVKGEDITDKLLDFLTSEEGPKNIPDVDFTPEMLTSLKAIPLWYNRYYYSTDTIFRKLLEKPKSRAQEVMEIERALLKKYRDPNQVTKPKELEERGGAYYSKIAVDIIDSIVNDKGDTHIVNIQNGGALPDLPDAAVVEVPAVVGRQGGRTVPTKPLEPSIRALIQQAKAYEELTVEAALNKSWSAAYRALITNPLGPRAEKATEVLNDLLATNNLVYE